MIPTLRCGRFLIGLRRPLIMGVVNVTPDSFSDAGLYLNPGLAIGHALRLIEEGADIIDIGGESTRPGAPAVAAEEELRRVLPVLRGLRDSGLPLAVDTMKPEVMRAAVAEGADLINDINALRADGAVQAVAESAAGVCLMHMKGVPADMQHAPVYEDVLGEVKQFLSERIAVAQAAGIARDRICIDPGFGFGKTVAHNMQLLGGLRELCALNLPVLFGASRKSSLGAVTGRQVNERIHASVSAALLAMERGAAIVRVHEVSATKDALAVWLAMNGKKFESTSQLYQEGQ